MEKTVAEDFGFGQLNYSHNLDLEQLVLKLQFSVKPIVVKIVQIVAVVEQDQPEHY